ncbi:MAG: AmmeMemoRadiSam system protein A [Planctomycetota bacterium]
MCFTGPAAVGEATQDRDVPLLSKEEEKTLLRLARHTLKVHLATGCAPVDLSDFKITPALKKEMGAFVTLKINGRLRGCIGYLQGIKPLFKAIIDNTISAASKDPRFPPVEPAEEPEIDMEISVLSPVVIVKNLDEIVVGRDGLIISQGYHRGTLLPQVPEEYGWNRVEFLEQTCRKAGLSREAYKDSNTKIEKYSAQVFSEKP